MFFSFVQALTILSDPPAKTKMWHAASRKSRSQPQKAGAAREEEFFFLFLKMRPRTSDLLWLSAKCHPARGTRHSVVEYEGSSAVKNRQVGRHRSKQKGRIQFEHSRRPNVIDR
jgi:hypothetical protein